MFAFQLPMYVLAGSLCYLFPKVALWLLIGYLFLLVSRQR